MTVSEKAKKISDLIDDEDTDLRGLLFYLIAEELDRKAQHYTSSLFYGIAREYGVPEDFGLISGDR